MTDHATFPPQTISSPFAWLGRAVSRAALTVLDWQSRQASRRQLLAFDERALKDIGAKIGRAHV